MEQFIFSHRQAYIFLANFIQNPKRIVYELEPFYDKDFITLLDLQSIINSL
jgi:hypothetical protein